MLKNKKNIYIIIIALVIIVILLLYSSKLYFSTNKNSTLDVNKIVISKSISYSTKPLQITDTFNHLLDRSIYMFVYLNKVSNNEQVSYVRYLNGYYIDSYSINLSSSSSKIVYFNWDKTHQLDYPIGHYSIKVFINGIFKKQINYSVV